MSAGNSSFPENRVVPPVRPVPAPSAWCGDREEGGREALLAGSHIPGGVALLQVTVEGGASCLQVLSYTTVMNSGMSLVIYSLTGSLHK